MATLNEILDSMHEFEPNCYTLDTLDEHLLGANNALESLREHIEEYRYAYVHLIQEASFGGDYRKLEIAVNNILDEIIGCSEMHMDYLNDEAEWTRDVILEKMKCEDDARHFEDYMNKPITSTKYVRDEIKKNHFSNMFGTMLTPGSGTRQTHASIYFDTDSVIDGRDKTPCMYDYAEDILNGNDDIAICKASHKRHQNEGDCVFCTEPCCSQSGVNK